MATHHKLGSCWIVRALCLALPLAISACSAGKGSQCSSASDCGATDRHGCNACAPQASKYCEGGACVDRPSGTSHLTINVTTPMGSNVASLRYALVDFKTSDETPECAGKTSCPANTGTCEDIKSAGMDSSKLNVASSGLQDVDSMMGSVRMFSIDAASVPTGSQYIVVEGRSGRQAAGDRVGWACSTVNPSGAATAVSVFLVAP